MLIQSRHKDFNIGYNNDLKKFFILSKTNDIKIGGFNLAAEAIQFALDRVS